MNIVGHKNILEFLSRSLNSDKLAHAYLFYGPPNVGKKTVAVNFVIDLLTKDSQPAEKIQIEDQINKKIHPDIYFVEKEAEKKNIGIEQIRQLQTTLHLRPFSNSYKIAIINRAEEMSESAANSFLKILEEPPQKSIIILLVNNLKILPKTIASRCQLIKFNPVSEQEIKKFLIKAKKISAPKAGFFAKLSFGRPGLAIKFLNEPDQINEDKRKLTDFLKILRSGLREKINFAEQYSDDAPFLIWQIALRDLILIKNNLEPVNSDFITSLKPLAEQYSEQQIYQALKLLKRTKKIIEFNVNKKLALENLLINI